jgi:hypothetical protein
METLDLGFDRGVSGGTGQVGSTYVLSYPNGAFFVKIFRPDRWREDTNASQRGLQRNCETFFLDRV